MSVHSYPHRIGHRLVVVFVLFVVLLIGGSGWVLYQLTRKSLNDDLGDKLMAIAHIAASQINGSIVINLRPGDEETRTYINFAEKLKRIKAASDARRLYVFDREHRLLLDTEAEARIGQRYIRLDFDQSELALVWKGETAHSVLFQGKDGRFYKSGYAPVLAGARVVAGVGIEASAPFVATIRRFRQSVILFAGAGMLVTVIIGLLFAQTITRPIHRLVRAAEEIGQGHLDREIEAYTQDELGYLAASLNEMRQNIVKRDHQLKTMLASIAHEIRNPLGSIEIFAGLAADELAESSPEKGHVAQIAKEAQYLNQIITEFLDFARPKEPMPEAVALNDLIDDAYFLLAFEFDEKRIMLRKRLSSDHSTLHVDPEQMKRVLLNLFKNAIQAMEPGGQLRIRSRYSERGIVVEVEDTGTGISKEDLPHLFEPFYTTREKGVGLGLAIVKKTVEDNKGQIVVHSKPGEGTIFAFTLPEHHSVDQPKISEYGGKMV